MALAPSAAERTRLAEAVKSDDSPFTTFLISPWSKYLAWGASRVGLRPNQVTLISLAVAVVAAAFCAGGTRTGYVVGAVLLQLSFGLDCADGQLARFTGSFSPLGGWLDAICDRLKEYAVYAGLALGSARAGDDVWMLAIAALVLQTLRHRIDQAWAVTPASITAREDGAQLRASGGRRSFHWARKVAVLPIGERWALISVLVALGTPRITFVVLLVAGALSGAYMMLARVRRARALPPYAVHGEASRRLDHLRDAGPVAGLVARGGPDRPRLPVLLPLLGVLAISAAGAVALEAGSALALLAGALAFAILASLGGRRPPGPRWGWTVPPMLQGAEYAAVVTAVSVGAGATTGAGTGGGTGGGTGVGVATYAYLLVLIWHHYDSAYRLHHGLPERSGPLVSRFGGFEVRTVAVAALAVAVGPSLPTALAWAAAALTLVAAVRSRHMWQEGPRARDARVAGRGGQE